MPQPFNRDKFLMLPRDRGAVTAHVALDSLQSLPSHEQMAAVATLFAVFTQRFGLDPEETYRYGMKMLTRERFHSKGNAQVEALEAFAGMSKQGALT